MAVVDPSQGKEEAVPLEGIVDEVIRDVFWVTVPAQPGLRVKCSLSGKLRKHNIRITPGDAVDIQVSPYDLQAGRIVYRRS